MRTLALLLLVAFACNPTQSAEPLKITVSKETTYITEPLGEDGLPDYRRAWLERLRKKKVPASENGAVDYWQVVGLEAVDEKYRQAFCDELGMPMPKKGEVLESVDSAEVSKARAIWYLSRMGVKLDEAGYELYQQQFPDVVDVADMWPNDMNAYGVVLSYPADEVTPLNEWLARNSEKLDRLAAALDKPGWYNPAPSLCIVNNSTDLGMPSFEWRGVYQGLATRARVLVERGELESAVRDLTAIHRLSDQNSPDLWIDLLSGSVGKRLYAAPVELLLLGHPEVSDALLRQLQYLRSLSAQASQLPQSLEGGERVFALNFTVATLRKDPDAIESLQLLLPLEDEDDARLKWVLQALDLPVDANRLLKGVNQDYDDMAKAYANTNTRETISALKELRTSSEDGDQILLQAPETLSPRERADAIRLLTNQSDFGSADTVVSAEAFQSTHSQLMHLALALGRYRLAEGQYPDALDALVPRFVPELPADAFGNETFGYRKTDQGFLLYSYGLNGVDDGGSHHDMEIFQGYTAAAYKNQVRKLLGKDDPGKGILNGYVPVQSDDIAIRVPLIHIPLPGPDHG
jgi:hypothetical protein